MPIRMHSVCTILLLSALVLISPRLVSRSIAQVTVGTVIVVFFSQDKVVLAADSRDTLVRKGKRQIVDRGCKVSELHGNLIAAFAGATGREYEGLKEPWDALEIARQEARRISRAESNPAKAIAEKWGARMQFFLDADLKGRLLVDNRPSSNLATGVFAGITRNGEMKVYTAVLSCACDRKPRYTQLTVSERPPLGSFPIAVIGSSEAMRISHELAASKTERAKKHHTDWQRKAALIPAEKRGGMLTVYVAERIILYAGDDTIGGDVDGVQLVRKGSVTWLQEKNCREKAKTK